MWLELEHRVTGCTSRLCCSPFPAPYEVNSQIETRRSLQLVKMRKVQEMSNNFSNDINPFHVYDKRRRGQRGAAAGGGPGGGEGGGAAGKGDGKHCEICMCHSCSYTALPSAPSMAYRQLPHVCVCLSVCVWRRCWLHFGLDCSRLLPPPASLCSAVF